MNPELLQSQQPDRCCIRSMYDRTSFKIDALSNECDTSLSVTTWGRFKVHTCPLPNYDNESTICYLTQYPIKNTDKPESTHIKQRGIRYSSRVISSLSKVISWCLGATTVNHTAVSTEDDFNIKKGSGFVLAQSDFHQKMLKLTDDELEFIEQALHQSVTYWEKSHIRYQTSGFVKIVYCHHSQRCFLWHATPNDMKPLDEKTLNAIMKIQDKIYQNCDDRCYSITVGMNIHSKETTQRLRWHQDLFGDKLIDLLFTIVLSTPNNKQSQNHKVELGLVHQQEDVNADGDDVDDFLFKTAKGSAQIDDQGVIQLLSTQEDGEIFHYEKDCVNKHLIKQKDIVYLMASVPEKRGTGYYINQPTVYTAAGEKFKIVHSASPIKKPESSVYVKNPVPQILRQHLRNRKT